jgi:sugar (pentulose or hexulose) kinase
MEKVIAVFDIGKTNKKMLLFNKKLGLVLQQEEKFPTIYDDDNFECDNIDLIVSWIKESVESLIKQNKYDLLSVNFSTYGATLAFVGENGKMVTPLYNYLKPMPKGITEPIYDKFGGVEEFCRCTASPSRGMLNSGMQILWLKKCKPQLFQKVKYIMHFPQYLSYCFTKQVTTEYTSIGCHSALWNFDLKTYHSWVSSEGIQLPQPLSNDTTFDVTIAGKTIGVGIGIHDSSAALVPYFLCSKEQFILISTGTWFIFMNPFNEEPLTKEQLDKDTLCYMSTLRQQVKSSQLFMGHIHDMNVHQISEFFMVSPNFYKEIKVDETLLEKLLQPGSSHRVFFNKGIPSDFVDRSVDLSTFAGITEAYHQLIVDLTYKAIESLNLIIPGNDITNIIYVSGGFARNEIFLKILSKLIPQKRIFTSEVDNASALGAALSIYSKSFKNPAPDLDLGLKEF